MQDSQDLKDRNLWLEAASRVIMKNCAEALEFETDFFDNKFYTVHEETGRELFECYNTRMKLHLGKTAIDEYHLKDFDTYKQQYLRYRSWLPQNEIEDAYFKKFNEDKTNSLIEKLHEKTQRARNHRFDF